MNTSLIKLAAALLAPAMIVSSTAMGQGEKPPLPSFELQSVGAVPSKLMPSAFTYQGQLRQNNLPVTGPCNATFRLFDAETAGSQIGATVDIPALQVQNGLFNVVLDFGWNAFNGEGRWLEVTVGCGQRPVTLAPRTPLRPAPYALALPGLRTVPGSLDGSGNPTMNVIGGLVNGPISNTITPDSYNSVIAGGTNNRATLNSTDSVIGGGSANQINDRGVASVIVGGESNRIDGYSTRSVIGGGYYNKIDKDSDATIIAGGGSNLIDNGANFAVILGGYQAHASFFGQQAFASGGFVGSSGTAQSSQFVLRNQTNNAQLTKLYLDGVVAELALPLGRAMLFDIQVMAEGDAVLRYDMGAYHFIGAVNNYGNTQLRAAKTVLWEDANAVGWDANVTTNDGHSVTIVVVGGANQNVRWVATVRTTEVEWPAPAAMNAQDVSEPVPEK